MLPDKVFGPGELTEEAIEAMIRDVEKAEKEIPVENRLRDFASQSRVLISNPNRNFLVDLKIAFPFPFLSIEPDTIDPGGGVTCSSFSAVFAAFRSIHTDPKIVVQNLSSMATLRVFWLDASQNTQSYQSAIGPQAREDFWLDIRDQLIILPSHFHSRDVFEWKKATGRLLLEKQSG